MLDVMQRQLSVLGDFAYIVRNRRMAQKIQSGESVSLEVIANKLKELLKFPGLTLDQARQVRALYYPYKVSTIAHRAVLGITGEFRPESIPQEMYFAYIDPYLNNRKKAVVLENKCLFPRLYPGIRQPEAVAYRIEGFWLTPELAPMKQEEAYAAAKRCGTVFVKKAEDSYGGRGVVRVQAGPDGEGFGSLLEDALGEMRGDVLIQKPIRQHEGLARLNPSSVNTYRIITLLNKDGVQLLSAFVRFGVGDTPVDNYTSGGLVCGIDEEGRLKRFAYSHKGCCELHPITGMRFKGYALPAFAEAVNMVKKAHPMLPTSRLVFWDVTVAEDGGPVLIEANLTEGGIDTPQITNGPLFAGSNRAVIEEALQDSDFPKYRWGKRARVCQR